MDNPTQTTPRDCEHGQLARSCNICELQAILVVQQNTLAALNAVLSRDSLDELIDTTTPHISATDVSPTAFGMGEVARAGAEKFRDALFYKVAALKQGVAPEPYGDLVSRTRAIEELRAEMKRHGAGDVCNLDGTFSDGDADTCNQADYAAITALKRGVDRISALEGNAASNGVGQMDDLEAAFKKLRREVALSRSTPGSSLETLCQQIDRIIGKAL